MKKLILFAVILACDASPSPSPSPSRTVFDPFEVAVGDTIAGVRLAALDVQLALDSLPSGSATFAGPIELRGEYRPHFDYPEVNVACFWVDSATTPRVPLMKGDSRRQNWFCFRNQEHAIRELGALGTRDTVTIVIDTFTTHVTRSDAWNEATLLRKAGP